MSKKLVLLDHDGAIDDFLATILLMTMPSVQPLGVVITPKGCYIKAAISVTRKILDLMGRCDVPVAESKVRGINPFPAEYRRDCVIIDNFPILNESDRLKTLLVSESGQEFMVRVLHEALEPVTLMITGPLSTVAAAIAIEPRIIEKISEIVWMGGALNVGGNVEKVFALEHDGSAEWNVFGDPIAADRIWQTEIPITLCPLDLTNTVPVDANFIRQLTKQRRYPISDLAGLCYSLAIPQNYYFWDVLATAYLDRPELYRLIECETKIISEGRSQGRTMIKPGGKKIQVMQSVNNSSPLR